MGQAEQSIQHVCGLAELKQVRDWEKRLVELMPHYKTLMSENLGTHCHEWSVEKSQCRSTNVCRSQQQATWHRDLHRRFSQNGPVWLGVRGQAGKCTRRQWSRQSHDLQSDHGGRSSHTCNTVAIRLAWSTDYTCHRSHRLNAPPANGGVWNRLPRLAPTAMHSLWLQSRVNLLSWAHRSQWEWTGR